MEIPANKYVVKYGDYGDKFYIILKGELTVQVPNPKIKDWEWANNVFNELL